MLIYYLVTIFAGIAMMAASLKPALAILSLARGRPLHRMWQLLVLLVLLLIVGCTTNVWFRLQAPITTPEIIVATIVFVGGTYVLIAAHLSAIATRDIVRVAALESEVMRDPLTGAFNRRYLENMLRMATAKPSRQPLSAMLIDIDHFKRINDTYGHLTGDRVLTQVCAVIKGNSRTTDIVVRYGGEEFIVVSPGSDLDAVTILGNRILRQIAAHAIALPDGAVLHVTASIGAAALAPDEDPNAFIARADQALYAAKHAGRNRLCSAPATVEPMAA